MISFSVKEGQQEFILKYCLLKDFSNSNLSFSDDYSGKSIKLLKDEKNKKIKYLTDVKFDLKQIVYDNFEENAINNICDKK